MVLDWSRCAGV